MALEASPRSGGGFSDPQHVPARIKAGQITGVRKMILDRAADMRVTLADLSRAAGKNTAYVHQYIFKGTPRRLDEDTRKVISAMLQISDDLLRDTPLPPILSPAGTLPQTMPGHGPTTPLAERQVPVFSESDPIEPARATQWAAPIQAGAGTASFALWIESPRARLAPGDMVFVKSDRPARRGDMVVAMTDNHVTGIGELEAINADTATIQTGKAKAETFQRSKAKILKIIGVLFP